TIYDPEAKKYLVYFTIRFRGQDNLDFYSAYANADFTGFEAEPTLMFRAKHGAIDGDIVLKDGVYHLFFKGNTKDGDGKEYKNGIKQATSRSLQGPWVEDEKYLDAYANKATVVEGSSVFKLNDSDQYVLMYDLYSDGRYEFQRSADLSHFTPNTESFTKDFHPRHGSVIGITHQEAARLNKEWGGAPADMLRQMKQTKQYDQAPDPTVSSTGGNPIISDVFTADPAPLVVGDTVYLYVGHDDARPDQHYTMPEWYVFSSQDLVNWRFEGAPLAPKDFRWASRDAYAAHVAERNGKFFFYVSTEHDGSKPGKAIGVAVADHPTGPFVDARGSALVTADMTPRGKHSWEDIDPAVFTDDDGASYLFWGNVNCYYAKLKENMIELDGPIERVPDDQLHQFTEAPWVHKKGDLYYLTYASGFPEKIAYSTAEKVSGPWTPRGVLAEVAGNSNTIHQGIVTFKGKDYFFYHNGSIQAPNTGGSYRRSVCIDELRYDGEGNLRRVLQTTEGIRSAD
ncbi:MAG: family 43 glycosylhydrolase, partial [Planctomycetales bacterium]|nr:family 43 glycosylhydrolase [Planctomycetales bacterium]